VPRVRFHVENAKLFDFCFRGAPNAETIQAMPNYLVGLCCLVVFALLRRRDFALAIVQTSSSLQEHPSI
jgi:hypothetical protein